MALLEVQRTFYHADLEKHEPANPDLLNRILSELDRTVDVRSLALEDDKFKSRVADGSLLMGIDQKDRDRKGIVVEGVGRALHENEVDVWSVIETVTDPGTGIKGDLATIFSYFEGRDDQQGKHFGGVLHLKQYFNSLRAHSHKKQSAIALWDVHSGETMRWLEKINGRKNKPEIVSLTAMPLFVDQLKKDGFLSNGDTWVAAPDFGSFTKTREMAKTLDKPMIFIDKYRPEANHLVIRGIFMVNPDGSIEKLENSELKGKRVLFFDDMFDTGGTAVDLSKALKDHGVSEVIFTATHGVFSDRPKNKVAGESTSLSLDDALERKIIDYLYVSDSLPQYKKLQHENVRYISIAEPIAALIRIASDHALADDYDLVKRCMYNPGPNKKIIERFFRKGNITPVYENFDFQDAVYGNREHVVFSRQPNLVN